MVPAPAPGYFRSDVPAGTSGAWVIEKVLLEECEYDPSTDSRPECFRFRPGSYTLLRRDNVQFMTDLYDEWWTQRIAIDEAVKRGGEVLITGLGLGLIAEALLRATDVARVTVVEFAADVIRLVAPHIEARHPGRIEIVQGDAFSWEPPPGRHFTIGWHDIWPDPYTPENAAEMTRLEARYAACCDWQGFWPREYLRAARTPH
jgi:hypothetical protein